MLSQQPFTTLQWVTAFLGLMRSVLELGFMSPLGSTGVTDPQPAGRGRGWGNFQKQNWGWFSYKMGAAQLAVQVKGLVEFSSHHAHMLFLKSSART